MFQSSLSKGGTNKATAVSKQASNVCGGLQNSGISKDTALPSVATVLPQSMTTVVGKGVVAVQDKAGKWGLT